MQQDAFDHKLAVWAEEAKHDSLSEIELLTQFVMNNTELEQLEDHLHQFNIFEAIGMHKQELRHSAFLSFLLDPRQPHGLGDDFLKKVLQRALLGKQAASLPVNVVKLHLMKMDDTTVEREWNNIDILLLNELQKLAVIIENKVWTGEHDNQLDRYYRTVQRHYPDYGVIGLYLTPDGAVASDKRYLPIGYAEIAEIIETLVVSRETVLGPDVRTLMTHYVQMLRRNIVSDAEIDELCRQIYQKHKRAIDLIVARIPDKQSIVHQALLKMVEETPGIRMRWHSSRQISFHPVAWDVPALQYAEGYDAPALLFQFYIYNSPDYIRIMLELRRGSEERRKPLFEMAVTHGKPFNSQSGKLKMWNVLYSRGIINRKQMPLLEPSDIIQKAYEQFSLFLDNDLPEITKALAAQEWVWTTDTTDTLDTGEVEHLETEEEEDGQSSY